jgi:hypothetical protein
MTLHEAIVEVLTKKGVSNSTSIATLINERQLYKRKDGKPVRASQITARISHHPELFVTDFGNLIQLKSRKSTGSQDYESLFLKAAAIFRNENHNFETEQSVKLVLWLSYAQQLRDLVERMADREESKSMELLKLLSVIHDISDGEELRKLLLLLLGERLLGKIFLNQLLIFCEMPLAPFELNR